MEFIEFLTYLGAFTFLYFLYNIFSKIHYAWTVFFKPSYTDFSKYGKWSVVTGSTDGIGKAIALELASKGQNIILIARNQEKLENVSREIVSKHGTQVKYLVIDFSHDESIYDEIQDFCKPFDVGVLVNNVGISVDTSKFVDVVSKNPQILKNITRINIYSVFKMTNAILPGMVERGRGLIINVSSSAAVRPMFPIYGSSKAFVNYFSQALHNEYEEKGIIVFSCMPGVVITNMTKEHVPKGDGIFAKFNRYMMPLPDAYAKATLATVGKEKYTYGCWQHAYQAWVLQHLPDKMIQKIQEQARKQAESKKTE